LRDLLRGIAAKPAVSFMRAGRKEAMLARQIHSYLAEHYEPKTIQGLRIGLIYTGILLDDGSAGAAYTFRQSLPDGYLSLFGGSSPLAGTLTHALLPYLGSSNRVEAAVALAVANALVNRDTAPDTEPQEVLDMLDLSKHDRVAMVGFFRPLVDEAKRRVKELLIFEQAPDLAPGLLPAAAAVKELPCCDVALITSTSLVNSTVDSLLEAAQHCREVVLLGPSTLMLPEVFAPCGVTMLSGLVVTDPCGILRAISEGGGVRSFKGFVRKKNLRLCRW